MARKQKQRCQRKIEDRIRQIEKGIEEKGSNELIKEIVDSLKALGGGKKSLGGAEENAVELINKSMP